MSYICTYTYDEFMQFTAAIGWCTQNFGFLNQRWAWKFIYGEQDYNGVSQLLRYEIEFPDENDFVLFKLR